MLEDYLVELLARNFDLDTFGCELMLTAEDVLTLSATLSMRSSGKTRGFNWSSIKASGKCTPKSRYAETIMKTTPRHLGPCQ